MKREQSFMLSSFEVDFWTTLQKECNFESRRIKMSFDYENKGQFTVFQLMCWY